MDGLCTTMGNDVNLNVNVSIRNNVSGREKLRRCREKKEAAREAFKKRPSAISKNKKKNCVTSPGGKSETLIKNSRSAAAQRHARDVYKATLENEIELSEKEREHLAKTAIAARTRRDELALRVQQLKDMYLCNVNNMNGVEGHHDVQHIQQVRAQQEEAYEEAFNTEKALAAAECAVTPRVFAESLLQYPTTCAL